MPDTIPQNCTWVGGVSPADLDDRYARGDRSGHYEHLLAQRARILANCPRSHRRRILGIAPDYRHAKVHEITIDLRTGERLVTAAPETPVKKAPPRPLPVVRPPLPDPIDTAKLSQATGQRSRANRIVAAVAETWGVTPYNLASPSRQKRYCQPRFACYWLLSCRLRLSSNQIGRMLGRRDHTSVLHGLHRARTLYSHDAGWRAKYDAAVAALNEAVKS